MGPVDALQADVEELGRRVAISDEEIDLLQVEVAKNKRKWYGEPSVLVATLALAVSIAALVVGQVNIISEGEIQDRNRLSALIQELPTAIIQEQEKPSANDLVLLIAGSAAALIDRLDPESSTADEKIMVAVALAEGSASDLPAAMRLATAAEYQTANVREKAAADRMIAHIHFLNSDAVSGRQVYQRAINLLQKPQNGLDSSLLRDLGTISYELFWASDEFALAKSCPDATEHVRRANQILDRVYGSAAAANTNLGKLAKTITTSVTAGCSPAAK
jgi:hypothetical protein